MAHAAALPLILVLAGLAQPAGNLPGGEAEADAARTRALNGTAAATNRRFKDAVAAYDAAQARYEAALRDNARARAAAGAAARAYDDAHARYETEMAGWRAGTTRVAPTKRAAGETAGMTPAPAGFRTKMVCRTFRQTGSLVQTYRECKRERDWDREHDNIRTPPVTSGSCRAGEC